jgi:hypothetical protein
MCIYLILSLSLILVKIKLIITITKMLQYIVLMLALANPNYVNMVLHPTLRPTHAPTPAHPKCVKTSAECDVCLLVEGCVPVREGGWSPNKEKRKEK